MARTIKKTTRSHYIIPDCQIRPGDATDHLVWIAQDIVKRKPDVIVNIGDFWDFPSMSTHAAPGSAEKENQRFTADLKAGNDAMAVLMQPIIDEMERTKRNKKRAWKPRMIFTKGNHENRADRFASTNPLLEGVVGSHLCDIAKWGYEVYEFEQPVEVDSVYYAHYWKGAHSPRPLGGTIDNRLNKLGFSFVQGHQQGKMYGDRMLPNGKTIHGLVLGSCYLGTESYRGPQGQSEWRGTGVLHDVRDGDYEPMFLTLRYLCREYAGEELHTYMQGKYPKEDWAHLA